MASKNVLTEVRCTNCSTLNARVDMKHGTLEIKCRKCGTLILVEVHPNTDKKESRSYTERLQINRK